MRACTYGGRGTPTTNQHNILTRKNSDKFVLCPGRDSNLWSWNPLDLEADALPIEPPRPPKLHHRNQSECIQLSGGSGYHHAKFEIPRKSQR